MIEVVNDRVRNLSLVVILLLSLIVWASSLYSFGQIGSEASKH